MPTNNLEVLDTTAAAEYLGLARSTMAKLRLTGNGPVFCKMGRRVLYRRVDLDAYLETCLRQSTSEGA